MKALELPEIKNPNLVESFFIKLLVFRVHLLIAIFALISLIYFPFWVSLISLLVAGSCVLIPKKLEASRLTVVDDRVDEVLKDRPKDIDFSSLWSEDDEREIAQIILDICRRCVPWQDDVYFIPEDRYSIMVAAHDQDGCDMTVLSEIESEFDVKIGYSSDLYSKIHNEFNFIDIVRWLKENGSLKNTT